MDRELGDVQPAETADLVSLGVAGVEPVGQPLAQALFEGQHVVTAAEFENVDGILVLDGGHDRHLGGDLADGQGDIGVERVGSVGQNQAGLGGADFLVGFLAVEFTADDRHTVFMQPGGPGRVGSMT